MKKIKKLPRIDSPRLTYETWDDGGINHRNIYSFLYLDGYMINSDIALYNPELGAYATSPITKKQLYDELKSKIKKNGST